MKFLELQQRCDGMSSSTLAVRLRELEEAQLVSSSADGNYGLTELGHELPAVLKPLISWADAWADQLDTAEPAAMRPGTANNQATPSNRQSLDSAVTNASKS